MLYTIMIFSMLTTNMRSLTSKATLTDVLNDRPPFEVSLKAAVNTSIVLQENDKNKTPALIQLQVSNATDNGANNNVERPPSTVVLVIDESGSMQNSAAMHDDSDGASGLSQLDIVKHAARTVVEILSDNDHLAVVAFSSTARTVLPLTPMTAKNRDRAKKTISDLHCRDSTNLYDGLIMALDLIRNAQTNATKNSNVMLLTDGLPNVSPPRGELASLQRYLESQEPGRVCPRISTFGFGYQLQSDLLQNIAKEGRSHFCFIPDSSFVGTVFVNAVANLLATALPETTLQLEAADDSGLIELEACVSGHAFTKTSWGLSIQLPSLLYGQKLDVVVNLSSPTNTLMAASPPFFRAMVVHGDNRGADEPFLEAEKVELVETGSPLDAELRCAIVRSEIVQFLHSQTFATANSLLPQVKARIARIAAAAATAQLEALRQDVDGQITEACDRQDWHKRWGRHYLLSLQQAHTLQQCTNFKDPGLQGYATDKFAHIRDGAEDVFVKLPPPKPSREVRRQVTSMRNYYRSSAPCFAPDSVVSVVDGSGQRNRSVSVADVRAGDWVQTANGPARIRCVVQTACLNGTEALVQLGDGIVVTPWHPVRSRAGGDWKFPCELKSPQWMPCNYVYSFVLEEGSTSMRFGKSSNEQQYDGIALGHRISNHPVLTHDYLGTARVVQDLQQMKGWSRGLVQLPPSPAVRDPKTNWIVKFVQDPHENYQAPEGFPVAENVVGLST